MFLCVFVYVRVCRFSSRDDLFILITWSGDLPLGRALLFDVHWHHYV